MGSHQPEHESVYCKRCKSNSVPVRLLKELNRNGKPRVRCECDQCGKYMKFLSFKSGGPYITNRVASTRTEGGFQNAVNRVKRRQPESWGTMPFGAYAGRPMYAIPSDYIRGVMDSVSGVSGEVLEEMRRVLSLRGQS